MNTTETKKALLDKSAVRWLTKEELWWLMHESESPINASQASAIALDAWQSVFGTSQLTHAQARLEAAEKVVSRIQNAIDQIGVPDSVKWKYREAFKAGMRYVVEEINKVLK